ncbi:MAG: hypothetical protein RMJ47_08105 [Bacteroidota bacterium]|nr:hypothetical protein [Bacteroidota bacterium]
MAAVLVPQGDVLMRWLGVGGGVLVSVLLLGCVEDNPSLNPTITVSAVPVPEAAVAIVNESTVKVRWKPSPSQDLPAFRSYYLVLVEMATQNIVRRIEVSERKPSYELVLGGLKRGVLYGLDIWVRFRDNTLSSAPRTVLFAPAVQYTEVLGQPIRLYEQDAPPQLPNGLNFNQSGQPALLPRRAAAQWDICFEIVDGQARLGCVKSSMAYVGDSAEYAQGRKPLLRGMGRRTLVGSNLVQDVSALDEVWVSSTLDTVAGRLDTVMLQIPEQLPSGKGVAFFLMRADTTWAKVLIKPGPDGRLIQGTAPQRYVELAISYQTEKAVPSALTGSRRFVQPISRQQPTKRE